VKDALGDPQSVVVFGGASEIAQHIVRSLSKRRRLRTVVLAVRRPEAVSTFADELVATGVSTEAVAFDADEVNAHHALLQRVTQRVGDIDVAVLAFAVLGDQARLDNDPVAAAAMAHTNFVGSVSVALEVAQVMKQQGHGTIVVLSSVAGVRVRAANYVYGATKAGLDGFAQGLGDSLAGTGVRVMVVRPGFVRTKMTAGMKEVPFTTGPEAVADAVVRGLATGAHTVWSPPALQAVFGGLRLLPRALWRRMPG
jgi:decaprenylphospho-beta-D-erythro-pentofuranosid-2-ulose 2-reductase